MAEYPGDLFHDGQAQAQAAVLVRSLHVAAFELLENLLQALLGNPHAAVPHLDQQALLLTPATQHHPPLVGVANGIAEQVAQDPRQQLDVAAHQRRAADKVQRQAFGAGELGVLGGEVVEQLTQGERRDIGLDHASIQLGNIHQGPQQVFHVFQGVAHIAHQGFAGTLQQGTGEQPRRIQRLQQVMADGGEKLGFRQVGLLGLELGFAQTGFHATALVDFLEQLVIERRKLRGALGHALFQMLVGLVQGFGRAAAFGDIADQHEDPHHLATGQHIRDIGTQHVAFLVVDVGFGELEGHALPRQGTGDVGVQALAMLLAVHFAQALAEHHAARPAVPFFINLVGELIDQVGIQVADQRRHVVGDQADPALALLGFLRRRLFATQRFGTQAGVDQQVVAGLEFGHRLVQRVGALAHLLGQHHRMLEGGVGVVALGHAGLDALDQRHIDPRQLEVVLLQPGQLSGQVSAGLGQWRPR